MALLTNALGFRRVSKTQPRDLMKFTPQDGCLYFQTEDKEHRLYSLCGILPLHDTIKVGDLYIIRIIRGYIKYNREFGPVALIS